MNTMTHNALNAYSQVGVENDIALVGPHKLISMLFEGALVAIFAAKVHMQRNEIAAKGASISNAIAIIDEGLKASLDEKVGGELAQNLKALYEYMCHRLLVANMKNDIEPLEEVGSLLKDLKGAWDAIGNQPNVAAAGVPQPEPMPNRASLSYGKA